KLVSFCQLPLTEQLRIPSFSNCARKDAHTRAGGSTSSGSLWAAETMLVRSATKLAACYVHGRALVPLPAAADARVRLAFSCVAWPCTPSTGHQAVLPIDSESLGAFSYRGGLGPPPPQPKRAIGFRPLRRSCGTSS